MSSAVVRSGFDAHAASRKPSQKFFGSKTLELKSGAAVAFIYFRSPAPVGATITRATLRVRASGASSGSRTLSVTRVAQSWKQRQITWNNRPGTTGTVCTASVGTLKNGSLIEIDVTPLVQAWANGAPNYGMRISTSATTLHRLVSLNGQSKPSLEVEWSDTPAEPTDLIPSGGIVSTARPVLQFTFADYGGDKTLAGVQVQIRTAEDSNIVFDSGWIDTDEAALDLAETAFAGFDGTTAHWWRARCRDGSGLISDWSDWSDDVTYLPLDPPTILNPVNGVVHDTSPPIVWEPAGAQVRYAVKVVEEDNPRVEVFKTSGRGSDTEVTATGLKTGITYRAVVQVWDDTERVETAGAPAYAETPALFVVQHEASVSPVTDVTATVPSVGDTSVLVSWRRADAADRYVILRDGSVIADDVIPEDSLQEDGTNIYLDPAPTPHVAHFYSVAPVVNKKMGPAVASDPVTTAPEGIRIYDPESGRSVVIWGDDDGSWDMPEESAVYTPIGASKPVRVVSNQRGYEGSLSGVLMNGFGATASTYETRLMRIKGNPTGVYRLIVGDLNIPVILGNIVVSPDARTRRGQIVKKVTFDFWQYGQFDNNLI